MNIVGLNPVFIFSATIIGKVIVSTGHDDLVGKEIEFPFGAIEWNSRDCEEGGVWITLLGHSYTVIDVGTMKIRSLD